MQGPEGEQVQLLQALPQRQEREGQRPGAYKIQHLLEREYGIKISAGRVYRLMKGMNLPRMSTAIRPKSRKMNDDEG